MFQSYRCLFSVLPPIADIAGLTRHGRKVPQAANGMARMMKRLPSEDWKLPFQEQPNFLQDALRFGVLLQQEVVLSLQCYELCAGNSGGRQTDGGNDRD